MNAATSDTLIEITVKPIWRAPSSAARIGDMHLFEIAEAVLDHNDGVVDHEPNRTRPTPSGRDCRSRTHAPTSLAQVAGKRERHRDAGGDGSGPCAAGNTKTTSITSAMVAASVNMHVVDAGSYRAGAVGEHRYLRRRWVSNRLMSGMISRMRVTVFDHIGVDQLS